MCRELAWDCRWHGLSSKPTADGSGRKARWVKGRPYPSRSHGAALQPKRNPMNRRPSMPAEKPRILVVDDEPKLIRLGTEVLSATGFSVLTATSGEQAVGMAG